MADGGQQFGKYRILEELGAGGFATVFKAVDTTLDREVALKILHPPLLTDRRFVQSFRQEAKTLAALRHPHIITVYEVGEVEGRLFIAMDLAHGVSLANSITKRGRIAWEETLALLKPVCAALDYAHSQKVVHRDLKPANLLLDTQRGALLTDFGFARLMAESNASLSMSGGVVGTPSYIAPEVWENNAANPPVDIYALGCIVYEMLTGEVLFKGQTPMQAIYAHSRAPQFPETWPKDVPTNIATVLSKTLARDPAARYPSAGAVWHALNDLAAQRQAAREATRQLELAQQEAARRAENARREEARRAEDAKREADQRAALAAQWHAEAGRALVAEEWDAARMAIGRWRAVAPEDAAIREVQARLERLTAPSLAESQPSSPPLSKPVTQDGVLADLLERTTEPTPIEIKKPAVTIAMSAAHSEISPRIWRNGQVVGGAIGLIIVLFLIGVLIINYRSSDSIAAAPTTAPAAPAPTQVLPPVAPTNAAVVEPHSTAVTRPTPTPAAIDTPTTDQPWWSDHFDSELTSRFTASTTESAVCKFVDGTYQIIVTKPKLLKWATMKGGYGDASIGDASISVDASINGPTASAAGLIFHYQDDKNFYIYSVDGKGRYGLDVYKDGKPITLIDWTASSSIKPVGERNTLRVETSGVTIRLYVNDFRVHVISDGTIATGKATLVVNAFYEPNVTGTFDNLVVRGLN